MIFSNLSFHVKSSFMHVYYVVIITSTTDLDSPPSFVVRDEPFNQSHRKISTTNWWFHWDRPYTQDLSSKIKISSSKSCFYANNSPEKTSYKRRNVQGKAVGAVRGIIPPLIDDQPHTTVDTDSTPQQEPIASIQPLYNRWKPISLDSLRDERADEEATGTIRPWTGVDGSR